MNYPAQLFRNLLSTWHHDASNHHVEGLAAELAATVARAKAALCLGLMHKEAIPSLFGLTFLLDGYGLVLRQRYRQQGDGVFVFVEAKKAYLSEYAGTFVTEYQPEFELARAA
jgi:hypothetical protein